MKYVWKIHHVEKSLNEWIARTCCAQKEDNIAKVISGSCIWHILYKLYEICLKNATCGKSLNQLCAKNVAPKYSYDKIYNVENISHHEVPPWLKFHLTYIIQIVWEMFEIYTMWKKLKPIMCTTILCQNTHKTKSPKTKISHLMK